EIRANAKPETGWTPAFGAASDPRPNRSRSGRGGKALQWLRQGPAADRRRDQRVLRLHSSLGTGDSGRVPEVRLRLHSEDCKQAGATDREKHGGGKSVSASDRGKVGRSSAAAPAGKDVRAAWHPDLAQNHGRVDGAMRE